MAVGEQLTQAGVNAILTNLAVQWRNLCTQTIQRQAELVGLGLAGLEAINFGPDDAAAVLQMIDYMATPAGCYFGTVQQGGSGGTGAIEFDFDNALSGLWAGQ